MNERAAIGLVVPFAEDKVPDEGLTMYPNVTFVARGVGVRALTPEGYAPAMAAILPAAVALAGKGVDAIMVIGTSLTFYQGAAARIAACLTTSTPRPAPVSTMSARGGRRAARGRRPALPLLTTARSTGA